MILSVFFVGYKIYNLGFDISVVDDIPNLAIASVVAVILNILSTLVLAYAWGRWIAFFSSLKVNSLDAITIYGKSATGKYLPGNIMHYVERNLFASEYGLSQKKITFSTIMEIVVMILSGIVLSMMLLPASYVAGIEDTLGIDLSYIGALIAVGCVSFLIVVVIVFKRFNVKDLLKDYKPSSFMFTFAVAFLAGVGCLLFNGLGMYALWMGLEGNVLDVENLRTILSSYSAAWICGFVLPGAPGGIGVREAVLTALLDNVIEGPILVFLIIAHRIISIIGDFTFYAMVSIIKMARK